MPWNQRDKSSLGSHLGIVCGDKFLGPLILDVDILKIHGDHLSIVVSDGNLIKVSTTTSMTRENDLWKSQRVVIGEHGTKLPHIEDSTSH